MGPPRERDGETNTFALQTLDGQLQWGRRANATESFARAVGPAVDFVTLQWGRRANATERASTPRCGAGRRSASMGPPRERDGERANRWHGGPSRSRFNGAAARTRRRVTAGRCIAVL